MQLLHAFFGVWEVAAVRSIRHGSTVNSKSCSFKQLLLQCCAKLLETETSYDSYM